MRIFILLTGFLLITCACSNGPVYQEAPFDGSRVSIDIRDLEDSVPVFYTFRHADRNINYLILKIGDDIQSYFDACAECYTKKKGFRYEGCRLVCNLCNVGYPVNAFKHGEGSCYPFNLEGRLVHNIYEIDIKDIIDGGKYF